MPPVGSENKSASPGRGLNSHRQMSTTQPALEVITKETNYQGLTTMVGLGIGGSL